MTEKQPIVRSYGQNDLEPIHQLIQAAAKEDKVDAASTLENIPTLDELEKVFEAMGDKRNTDILVAEDEATGKVVGYGTVRWWQEDDGTLVYIHQGKVHPEQRRQGVGQLLLTRLQERIQEIATTHGKDANKVYGANSTETEKGTNELLQKNGYEKVWEAIEMEFTNLSGFENVNTPAGYELREVQTDAEKRAVYDANKDVYESEFGSTPKSEEDYREFLEDSPDSTLWKVLWHGDEIAGFVLSKLDDKSAEIMQVSVLPKFRRQGLGKYLMLESMLELKSRGVSTIRLHTDEAGRRGGRQLYESLGFKPLKVHNRYRKKLKSEGQ